MRVVFIGTVEFSLQALRHLLNFDVEVVGVCTAKGSKFNSDYDDLSSVCESNTLPFLLVEDINSQSTLAWIKKRAPDIVFCFGWSKLLKNDLLTLAPMGVLGFHPAALPANRGRHPIIWSLVLGLKKTASTFFFMDEGADSGDILSQSEVIIEQNDNARSLYDKITTTALQQMNKFVPELVTNAFIRNKQDDNLANTWRKRNKNDGQSDWRMSANNVHNLIRALSKPYVGAHFVFEGQNVKVWQSIITNNVADNIEPGKVIVNRKPYPIIKCGEGAIGLMLTEPEIDLDRASYL